MRNVKVGSRWMVLCLLVFIRGLYIGTGWTPALDDEDVTPPTPWCRRKCCSAMTSWLCTWMAYGT